MKTAPIHRRKPEEDGYLLVAVIFMLAIVILTLAVAVPRVRTDLQRDRELETMHRGQQYVRAIKLYYAKFGSYPPNIDALVNSNQIRFLRRRYLDPTTGKDDWKPIPVGQNKTPIMGFFGQPLAGAGSPIGGVGPGGVAGATPASSAFGSTDTTGSGSASASSTTDPGQAGGSGFSLGSGIGSTGGSSPGSSTFGGSTFGGSSPGGSTFGGSSSPGASSPTGGTAGSPTDAGGSAFGGQTFGGAGMMGVSPMSPKQSIFVYKKKNHYNEWEFLYSPLQDQMTAGGGSTGAIGQPAGGASTGIGAGGTGAGAQSGSGFSLGGISPITQGAPSSPTPQPSPPPSSP